MYVNGVRDSGTFDSKQRAAAWAVQREAELTGKRLPDHTLKDALRKWVSEEAGKRKGGRWEALRCTAWERLEWASKRISSITANDIAEWRDSRLKAVSAGTVRREMTLLRGVFEVARTEWLWLRANPFSDVRKPAAPASRKRRITEDEIERITLALGYEDGPPENLSQRTALAFLFALETAMRGGEIVRIRPAHCGPVSVHVPKSKNGTARDVPLTPRAQEILELVGKNFGLNDQQRETTFRAGRDRTTVQNLHFHDSRAEGIYRLSRKLNVLELARAVGQKDIKSLMYYYETTAEEMAARLA